MAKKLTGRKRHVLVDTLGLLLSVAVLPASVQDRDAIRAILQRRAAGFPSSTASMATPAMPARRPPPRLPTGDWTLEIVKRVDAHRFVVLPKRWIVERTRAWISRNRRLARNFERYARTAAAFCRLAIIRLLHAAKRLIKSPKF